LLSQLKSKGIFTALATGKGLYFVEDLLRNHNDLLNNYYVLYDGALVINPHTKKVLLSKPILQETVALLREKILKITNNFYLNKIDGLYSKDINLSTDSSLYKFWKNGDDCSGVYQIYIRDLSPEQVLRLKRVLKHRDVSYYVFGGRRGLYGMMLHHSASNKGKAIKCVLKEMKIMEENSVIIGDGINDVPAFNLKKSYKVAMPNSVPEILKLANIVLEPEQKIGEFLSRHYGI
jgi:hydroxymethylpyrimidine pyrophosphatase-like HAD family hydrolase